MDAPPRGGGCAGRAASRFIALAIIPVVVPSTVWWPRTARMSRSHVLASICLVASLLIEWGCYHLR